MTKRQCEYLHIIEKYFLQNHQLPPVEHLAQIAGTTRNAAHEMLNRLAALQVLKKNSTGKYMFSQKQVTIKCL